MITIMSQECQAIQPQLATDISRVPRSQQIATDINRTSGKVFRILVCPLLVLGRSECNQKWIGEGSSCKGDNPAPMNGIVKNPLFKGIHAQAMVPITLSLSLVLIRQYCRLALLLGGRALRLGS